jgi:ribosomal protein S27AE
MADKTDHDTQQAVEFFRGVLPKEAVVAGLKRGQRHDNPSQAKIEHECERCHWYFEVEPIPEGKSSYGYNVPKCPRCGQSVVAPNYGACADRILPPSYKFMESGVHTGLTCPKCGDEIVIRFTHEDGRPYRCCSRYSGPGSRYTACDHVQLGRWKGFDMVFDGETEPCGQTRSISATPTCSLSAGSASCE